MLKLLIISLLCKFILCTQAVCTDYMTSYTNANFRCILDSGFKNTDVLILSNLREIISEYKQNIVNALNSGMNVSVVLIPCRMRSPV